MTAHDSAAPEIVLEARNVSRRYPGITALDCVNFRVHRNQVNVLIGENGAGKSTLMRILAGVESADEGELLLDGKPLRLDSPRAAAAHGISIVHQELLSLTNLTISDNIFAGRELRRAAVFVDQRTEDTRSDAALRRLREPMRVSAETGQLPLGRRQLVEIARAVDQGARILILDEPTSALSASEAGSLFEVIADLKRSGVTVIYISHRLHELLHLGDQFTVLRSGRVAGEAPRAEATRQWIVERMTGRADFYTAGMHALPATRPVALSVTGLSLRGSFRGEDAQALLHDVRFTLRQGEILGVYGLLGAGRTELLEALAGLRPIAEGRIEVNGRTVRAGSVPRAIKAGIVLLPEDRQRDGLFPDLSIRENMAMASTTGVFLRRTRDEGRARKLAEDLHIPANNLELPVTTLSGGNQQKVLLARCLLCSPSVLLLDEPTRGVDVGAKAEIYSILRTLAAEGLSILFTSSEIEETRALANRALVLCHGNISAEFAQADATDENLFAAASPSVASAGSFGAPVTREGRPA
jgi:erythritol transport system ATP-binding protein